MPSTLAARLRAVAVATVALVTAGLLYAVPAQADTQPQNGHPETVSSDVLPTVQIDGIVWTTITVGNTAYVGGNFSYARPAGSAPGVNQVARADVLAFNLTTGALITGFVANTNGVVNSLFASPDGSRIYIGGTFTQVNGVTRNRLAAVNPTTGALITSFAPSFNGPVEAVVATNDAVYVGGNFTAVGSTTRTRVAALNASNGLVRPMNVAANLRVLSLAVSPDGRKLVLGGTFETLNGVSEPSGYGFGAVDTTTGEVLPWNINKEVRQAGNDGTRSAAINSLKADATGVYGTAYMYPISGKTLEGSFRADWANGDVVWLNTCKGDSYDIGVNSTTTYVAGHPHDCSTVIGGFPDAANQNPRVYHRAMAWTKAPSNNVVTSGEFAGNPTPTILNWWPDFNTGTVSGSTQGPWAVAATDTYVVFAGEFTQVNNIPQQGIVRFATRNIAPNRDGPRLTGANFMPSVSPAGAGAVNVRWSANWDRDNQYLRYDLIRDNNTASPIYTVTTGSRANFERPLMSFTDTAATGLTAGSHNYRVRVTDPFGNTVTGSAVTITTPTAAPSAYSQTVIEDAPSAYWRLGDLSGTRFTDWVGSNSANFGTGVTLNQAGAVGGDTDRAALFPGTQAGVATAPTTVPTTAEFASEGWFRTTSTRGGNIVDLGSAYTISTTTPATTADRALYLDSAGRVGFSANASAGTVSLLSARTGLNDGDWHHVAASVGPSGAQLFVDGVLAAQDTAVTALRSGGWGYWRIGGDVARTTGGPTFLNGTVDEVAVYSKALSLAQVQDHYTASGRTPGPAGNLAPTARFTQSTAGLVTTVDASASSDDGRIVSYAWNWGDNTTTPASTSPTASHTYGAAGTYTVTLTVTDDRGATGTATATVRPTGTPGNAAPVPSFTATPNGLVVNTDASASTDSDGTITSYRWSWGEAGVPSETTTSRTATHTYSAPGTYTITLTVTDNSNATASTTRQVTLSSSPPANAAPTASFTATPNGLAVNVDGSGSTDDGSIASYAWNWGDNTSTPAGTSATASHTYAAAGTYTITLTVTDNVGATGTTTRSVTTTAPAAGNIATDAFERTVTGGFGTADTGGAWTISTGASRFSVSGGTANIVNNAGGTYTATLNSVSAANVDARTTATVTTPGAGTQFIALRARVVGTSWYSAQLRVGSTGTVQLQLLGATTLRTVTLPGTFVTGDQIHIRLQVTGSNPTTLNAKAWEAGTEEPAAWQATATDSTSGLQGAGAIGLLSYLGSTAPAPVTTRFDNLTVTPLP